MKLTATRSPKFRRLMNITGLSRPATAGTLELLWLFAMEQAPSGDVGRWSDMDLEAELDWQGEPGELIAALVSAGWLDRCATHRLVIHDWADHLPDFLQKRVDRGTLTIATLTPCPDDGGHRPPSSANGGIREGKGSEAKPREAKPSEEPPAPRARRAKMRAPCPDALDDQEWTRVLAWAAKEGVPLADVVREWDAMRDYWRGKGELRADWSASFRTWLRNAKRFAERDRRDSGMSPAQAKAERTKEAGRQAYELIQQRKLGLIEGGAA